ncbi:hypothetical protein [Streptomyces sp. HB132]|uniref:hypothetical protein n=1 Tax=Streptomyces sp. HB132 TaxID=767388 RepID=UPI00195FC2AB|nr:hypothetical protein [Streptomyces sp. HB132]MBM7441485.1 hypothetical protein [Streptomyces sp. HB132]
MDENNALAWLVFLGLALLIAKLVDDYNAKPTETGPSAVTGPPWENRVESARHFVKLHLTSGAGDKDYQEAQRRLATGMEAIAGESIKRASHYGHYEALLHLAVIHAIEKESDQARWAFDTAVLVVNPAGTEPDDFRAKMVGIALVWLEARPWRAEQWEKAVCREHPGLSGSLIRAKAIEAILETIPPLKP